MNTRIITKIIEQTKKYSYSLISFIAGMLGMYIVLAYEGITITDRYTLINGDLLHIYIPAIQNICRDILNRESIYFAWDVCMGMNTSLYNAFYALSPFNALYLIFRNADIYDLTTAIILLKTGLASMAFQKFISKAQNVEGLVSVAFSICYSLCSFQLAYNTNNIIWLDAMFVLPFVFLYLHNLIDNDKITGLVFWYSYIFIAQFYMGYMIGIISALYFVLLMAFKIFQQDENVFKCILKYCKGTLISICISAFVWLPTLYFINENHIEDSTRSVSYYISIFDVLIRSFWGQSNTGTGYFPNVYCGSLVLVMAVLFFVLKSISIKDKLVYGILLLIVWVSFTIGPLYMFWHGFDIPDGWPYRFAYISAFLSCTIAAKAFWGLSREQINTIVLIVCALCLICIWGIKWQSARFPQEYYEQSKIVMVNLALLIVWGCIIILLVYFNRTRHTLGVSLVVLVVIIEAISGHGVVHSSGRSSAEAWYDSMLSASNELQKDADFYRVNSIYDICFNSGTLFGFNGFGHFASAENEKVSRTLSLLGMYSSPRLFFNYGATNITNMLFDIKYTFHGIFEDIYSNTELNVKIDENNEVLSLGYMVCGIVDEYNFDSKNAFENNNELLSKMTGEAIDVFKEVPQDRIWGENRGLEIYRKENGYEIVTDHNNGSMDSTYVFHVNANSNKKVYAYFTNDYSMRENTNNFFALEGGQENAFEQNGDLRVSYIKELNKDNEEWLLTISRIGSIESATVNDIYFCEYDESELSKAYRLLKNEQMVVEEYRDGYLKGHISVNDGKHILLTTIPYDSGWTAKVNGERNEIFPVLNGAFIALDIPENGEYDVEFLFEAKGSRTGISISVIALIGYIVIMIKEEKNKHVEIKA